MFSIIYEPVHGIIYKNSKKEKRVMRHTKIHKFCDATLNKVLEGLKSYNNDVKYGYIQKDLTKDETEYLKLFEEEIEERLKHRRQMRRWEIKFELLDVIECCFANSAVLGNARGIEWDKVENPNPQSTPQVLPSFEEYTPPATYPEEVEETLGIPIEVEPLDETPLEDLGLNTCNHEIPLSSREIPSIDEPEPQPQPLTNCPSSDISLGEEKGPEPHIIRIVLGRRLYLMRRSLEVLRKFHWMILGG
ncbi:hypothetical protein Tco_0431021 [Tanacetum coccineum]